MAECDDRDRRPSARRITAPGFPREKWLSDFDYNTNPHIQPAVIAQLATSAWVTKGEPLCLIGDSGTGRSHLLIGLGAAAATAGHRVKYVLAAKLVNELAEAADERQLSKTIVRYGRVDLLRLDELVTDRHADELGPDSDLRPRRESLTPQADGHAPAPPTSASSRQTAAPPAARGHRPQPGSATAAPRELVYNAIVVPRNADFTDKAPAEP